MKSFLLYVPIIISLLVAPGIGDYGGMLEVTTDIPSALIFVDGTRIGTAPVTILDLDEGTHQVRAEYDGYDPLLRSISIKPGGGAKIRFEFIPDSPSKIPGQIRIEDCVGTPEPVGLSGTSVDILPLHDGTLMAYYAGKGKGIICAQASSEGEWIENDSCLLDESTEVSIIPPTGPWVYPVGTGYRMLYLQYEDVKGKFASAWSEDGKGFSPEGLVTFRWEGMETEIGHPSMPTGFIKPDGTLFMFYAKEKEGISLALSTDGGRSFDYQHQFLLPGATDPSAIVLDDGSVGLFYTDLTPNYKGQRIWFVHASDPINLEKAEPVLVLETAEPGVWVLDPEIYSEKTGSWTLYFSVFGGYDSVSGISDPIIMKSVIDPDCLVMRSTHQAQA